ncbi:SapC family protein [Agarilytica rhodophyticola]|uniref:SapC family protein n=1 Tax=Agarilytica rhodophyticola TaxID=1737490 RepID=UPI000B346C04|nr:SapC family protein [Agarilytica rhodophyticola]
MASLLFYQNPVPLDKEKHKNLKLKKLDNLNFTSETNSVPVAGFEFFQCSRNHPVMFVKNANDDFVPVALLSLMAKGHNLGDVWEGVYIPSFVRRYPFVLEEQKGIVMVDLDAPHLQEEEGDALFDEKGEPSEALQEIMRFLENVDQGYRLTQDYIQALKEKDLLKPCQGTIKFTDTTLKLDHLFVVDEKEFHSALSDEEIVDWYKKGWIAWTYAHIHSIGAIPEVVKRLPQAKTAAKS